MTPEPVGPAAALCLLTELISVKPCASSPVFSLGGHGKTFLFICLIHACSAFEVEGAGLALRVPVWPVARVARLKLKTVSSAWGCDILCVPLSRQRPRGAGVTGLPARPLNPLLAPRA